MFLLFIQCRKSLLTPACFRLLKFHNYINRLTKKVFLNGKLLSQKCITILTEKTVSTRQDSFRRMTNSLHIKKYLMKNTASRFPFLEVSVPMQIWKQVCKKLLIIYVSLTLQLIIQKKSLNYTENAMRMSSTRNPLTTHNQIKVQHQIPSSSFQKMPHL